jgi:hypothetical protein
MDAHAAAEEAQLLAQTHGPSDAGVQAAIAHHIHVPPSVLINNKKSNANHGTCCKQV